MDLSRPTPPAYGTQIEQPTPPNPPPQPVPPSKWDGPMQQPLAPLCKSAAEVPGGRRTRSSLPRDFGQKLQVPAQLPVGFLPVISL
jgi:hypothetical protein